MDSIAYTPVREQLLSTAPATFPDSSVHPQTMMEFSRSWVSSNIRQNYWSNQPIQNRQWSLSTNIPTPSLFFFAVFVGNESALSLAQPVQPVPSLSNFVFESWGAPLWTKQGLRREPPRRFNNLHSEDGPSSLPTTRIPSDIPLPNYVLYVKEQEKERERESIQLMHISHLVLLRGPHVCLRVDKHRLCYRLFHVQIP